MTLRLIREPSWKGATLGVLFKDGHFYGWTLEDEIREVPGQPIEAWKVKGQTAIPAGKYRVVVTPSPRFGKRLPILLDVPGFTGIRIHALNEADESEGCIGVGMGRDDERRRILSSAKAVAGLTACLEAAEAMSDPVWLTIENPAS